MVMRSIDSAIDHPQIRTIDRIALAYLVTTIESALNMSPFDTVDTLILAVITARNVGKVTHSVELSRKYERWDQPVPDRERQPISRRSVAACLKLPVETVRRRIDKLIKTGLLKEVEGGVIVTGELMDAPALAAPIYAANFRQLRRMISLFRLHRIDLGIDPVDAPVSRVMPD